MLSDNGINVPLTLSLSCLPTFLSIVQRHFSYGGGGVLRDPFLPSYYDYRLGETDKLEFMPSPPALG